jgi:hypothetical protein
VYLSNARPQKQKIGELIEVLHIVGALPSKVEAAYYDHFGTRAF